MFPSKGSCSYTITQYMMHTLFNFTILSTGSNPCGNVDKGGCSNLCLPTSASQYTCACPSYGGRVLQGTECRGNTAFYKKEYQ